MLMCQQKSVLWEVCQCCTLVQSGVGEVKRLRVVWMDCQQVLTLFVFICVCVLGTR